MSIRVNATNRTMLTVIGVVLTTAGGAGLVRSFGGFGQQAATAPVVPEQVSTLASETWWFWPAVAVALLLIALLGLVWLMAQLRTDHLSSMDLTDNHEDGTTTLQGAALADALTNEVIALPGVSGATTRLRQRRGAQVELTVDLTERADISQVRTDLETDVVPALRSAVDDPALPVTIQLRPGRSSARELS